MLIYAWYSRNKNIYTPDAIHQILAYGTLYDIRLLKKRVGKTALQKLFISRPKKLYTSPSLNFIKKFILDVNAKIDEQKYLKNTQRNTR